MGVSLSKGQSVSLVKQDGGSLSQVRMGLGWDAMKKKGLFGGMKEVSVDLDASAILISAERQVLEIVYYGNLRSKDNSLMHTGDNLTGKGDLLQRAELRTDRERDRPGCRLGGSGQGTGALRAQWLRHAYGSGDGQAFQDRRRVDLHGHRHTGERAHRGPTRSTGAAITLSLTSPETVN